MDTNKQCQHTASTNQLLLAKCAHTSRSLTMLGCSYLIRISTSSCGSRLWGSTTWTHLRQMIQCLYRCISMIHHRYAAAHHSNIVNNTITVIINDTTVHLPTRTHTHTHPFNGPSPGLPRWASTKKLKPIWILLRQETVSGSDIRRATCKSAPRSSQITMPVPHHSFFYRPDALPATQPTASKHWRHYMLNHGIHNMV